MSDEVSIVFHVERAAGTTLRHLLFDHYGWYTGIVYPHYFEWEGKKGLDPFVVNEEVAKAKIIMGHAVYYGIHEVVPKPCHYVTFLRDPLVRMESVYNHIRNETARKGLPPPDFRTWFGEYYILTQVYSLCRPKTASLEMAKNILDHTSFIGLQETFDEDVKQLFYPKVYQKRRNVGEQWAEKVGITHMKFTEKERATVMAELDEDYQLYNYALELRNNGHNKGFQFPVV